MSNVSRLRAAVIGCMVVFGCSSGSTAPRANAGDAAAVLDVQPRSGATAVDPRAAITVAFNHPMMAGMELLVALHKGSIAGATVPGTSAWSADRTRLTFTPSAPLESKTTYVLHLSPNLTDAEGRRVDFASCAQVVGGQPAGGGMMGGRAGMMGPGWEPGSGVWGYGMTFAFTTA